MMERDLGACDKRGDRMKQQKIRSNKSPESQERVYKRDGTGMQGHSGVETLIMVEKTVSGKFLLFRERLIPRPEDSWTMIMEVDD